MLSLDYILKNYILILLLALILVLAGIVLKNKIDKYFQDRKVRKRFERGNKLELDAKSFLEKKGYTIIDYQTTYEHKYWVDCTTEMAYIQPDYVVTKKGKKYIVEVKSGEKAISPRNRNIRRQLLEYDYAIDNDGVLLLDMENLEIKLITFKSKQKESSGILTKLLIIIALFGVFTPIWEVKVGIAIILAFAFIKGKYLNKVINSVFR